MQTEYQDKPVENKKSIKDTIMDYVIYVISIIFMIILFLVYMFNGINGPSYSCRCPC